MSSNKKHFKNNIKKSGGGYCPARKNDYFCTRSTEVGRIRGATGRKKEISKKDGSGVGGEKKTITFAPALQR